MELSPNHPIYSANDFYREKLGTKLVKLALDGGFTCPNRDGTLSDKGCIFCSGKGSGDHAGERSMSISTQVEAMKEIMSVKWGRDKGYMAYFQAFTNTYAPLDILEKRYKEAIDCDGVIALSVATRPDCINNDICALLKDLSKRVYVCVELGLQTSNDTTAEFINRCYRTEVYKKAVELLNSFNIDVITHIILGLPGEDYNDMLRSVQYAVDCGTSGLKLQMLHIIKGTKLAEIYTANPFHVFTYNEYISLVADIVENIPPEIVIHRLTGDGDKGQLIEPIWSLDKRRVLNGISREFRTRGSCQGFNLQQK